MRKQENEWLTYDQVMDKVWPIRNTISSELAQFYLKEVKEHLLQYTENFMIWDKRRSQVLLGYVAYSPFAFFTIIEHVRDRYDNVLLLQLSSFALMCGILLALMSYIKSHGYHNSGATPQTLFHENRIGLDFNEQVLTEVVSYQRRIKENRDLCYLVRDYFTGLLLLLVISTISMAIYLAFRSKVSG